MSKRVCSEPGCPELTDGGRCTQHKRAQDQARGRRQARGYDRQHDRLRRRWQARLDAGATPMCGRDCGQPVMAGQDWALDHTDDRTGYLGPSHASCNNRAGGLAAHRA